MLRVRVNVPFYYHFPYTIYLVDLCAPCRAHLFSARTSLEMNDNNEKRKEDNANCVQYTRRKSAANSNCFIQRDIHCRR